VGRAEPLQTVWMPDNSFFKWTIISKSNQSHVPVVPILAYIADRRPHCEWKLTNRFDI
jgi:hypothetical protein